MTFSLSFILNEHYHYYYTYTYSYSIKITNLNTKIVEVKPVHILIE